MHDNSLAAQQRHIEQLIGALAAQVNAAHGDTEAVQRLQQAFLHYLQTNQQQTDAVLAQQDTLTKFAASKRLAAREERFRRLVENGSDIIFRHELVPGLRHTYMSPAVAKMTGYAPEDYYNRPGLGLEVVHPDDRHLVEPFIRGLVPAQTVFTLRFLHKDGHVVWTEQAIVPIYDDKGTLVAVEGIARDITEHRRIEQELRETAQRLRFHMENSPLAIIEIDAQQRFSRWMGAAEQMFGWKAEEVVGKRCGELNWVHEEDRERVYQVSGEMFAGRRTQLVCRNRHYRKDGSIIHCEWYNSVLVDENGKLVSVLSLVLDVTQRTRAENALRQSRDQLAMALDAGRQARNEAEAANRAKEHFLAVLSHELRTPLTPVLVTAQLLELDPSLPAEARESIGMIRRNVELEAKLIDDLLDLTRISRGKLELSFTTVDLHEKLQHIIQMCQNDISAKQLNLTVQLQAVDYHVQADAARLQQVLWNLLKNAVKFTPPGGQIALRSENPGAGCVLVTVKDTGVGIDADALPRVFNAFEQGGQAVTRQFGGLGLGLAISKGLVDLHGGTLNAYSAGKGSGATFTLELQTTEPQKGRETRDNDRHAAKTMTGRLLLVEDHTDSANAMALLLKSYGFAVVVADSVASALQTAQAEDFDLLVSDIGLPDGSGLDLLRQLRLKSPIKAIALSGYGMEDDIRKSKEAGFLAHLTKPVSLQKLEEVLRSIFCA